MANLRFFADYVKHILVSRNRHGVHSPFVYQLLDDVIYDNSTRPYFTAIETLRNRLKTDDRKIRITDLGAGSMINSNKEKLISDLAKNALKPKRIAQLLARIAERFNPEILIELGTCLGITTAYLSSANPDARIITIEGCPETARVAAENFSSLNLQNISLKVGNFDRVLPETIASLERIDFLFIDGNHRKEATINYFLDCLPKLHSASVLIFDDIYWSSGMKEAWREIKAHPDVRVTLDLFHVGIVFLKTDQEKEHFRIRYY